MNKSSQLSEPHDVLYRIKRGLSGYVNYLCACEMNKSFSEYLLYEPILRILIARNYIVDSEVPCPGIAQPKTGDKKRLDFIAEHRDRNLTLAIEVKWAKERRLDVDGDIEKLMSTQIVNKNMRCFLVIFGKESCIANINLPLEKLTEQGRPVIPNFGKTKYGCRIYEVNRSSSQQKKGI